MNDFVLPDTRYALSGDINIAYQVMGDGPIDMVLVPGVVSHVGFAHELPGLTAFLRRLSSFSRSLRSTNAGRDYPTGYPARRRSSSGWTMFAR